MQICNPFDCKYVKLIFLIPVCDISSIYDKDDGQEGWAVRYLGVYYEGKSESFLKSSLIKIILFILT